jgi:PleD family two-component response regulator
MHPSFQPVKILAVDDSAIHRKLIEHSLSGERYTVQFAKNGREALELFAGHQPAVLITDWNMPDIGGLELCRLIRRDFQGFHTHLILLSSNNDKEQVVEGLAAGADDYLTKPFHPGELVARVEVGRRIVELHRQIQAKNRLLEEMALTDALTGLPNRRAIDLWASRQLSAAATVTASFGIAGFRGSKAPDWNALVTGADTALYAAKHKGGNRIEFELESGI